MMHHLIVSDDGKEDKPIVDLLMMKDD
uniref:Uncharacterized protein n=1 Tax=Tetranychus urticae TaxID=32264 RepID=T1KMW4_TETUR